MHPACVCVFMATLATDPKGRGETLKWNEHSVSKCPFGTTYEGQSEICDMHGNVCMHEDVSRSSDNYY